MANNSKNRKPRQSQSRAAQERAAFERERKNEAISRIAGVAVFAVSVIFFFVAVISGEGLWNLLHNIYVGLFGILAACIFPILAIVIIVLYSLKEKDPSKLISKSVEAVILVLLISAFIHIVQHQTGEDFTAAFKEAFESASAEFNGGFFGAVIGWLLLTLGKAPAVIVDVVLIFVDVMLLAAITIIQFFKGTAKPVTKSYEKVAPVIKEKREERRLRKSNIDIPLDETPPALESKKPSKTSKKSSALDIPATENINDNVAVPRSIIDEINAANERKRQQIEKKEVKKEKSLDDIVKSVSEDKPEKPIEDFKVTDEQMKD